MYLRDCFALKPFRDCSLCSVCILPQPAFYSESAVRILPTVCILPLVRSLQSAVRSLRFALTDFSNGQFAGYFTDLEKKEHQFLKESTVFLLYFAPSLHFTLSLQSAFYTQSAFYPWSAVSSLQSAVCVLH